MIALAIQNATLAVVALLTGVALVAVALWLAGLISPRSFNPQKGEAYECGIPTRGESMAQFKVGYYLFAILFLMFDVETVFLYPWAVRVQELGTSGLTAIAIFFGIIVLGLVYAWRKGALEWTYLLKACRMRRGKTMSISKSSSRNCRITVQTLS